MVDVIAGEVREPCTCTCAYQTLACWVQGYTGAVYGIAVLEALARGKEGEEERRGGGCEREIFPIFQTDDLHEE